MKAYKLKTAALYAATVFLAAMVAFGIFWLIKGSMEMFPTEEQQGKARVGALVWLMVNGIPLLLCVWRIKMLRTRGS